MVWLKIQRRKMKYLGDPVIDLESPLLDAESDLDE